MKFCPTCQTRYDEEILRFCTKDGTPLVEENEPVFTELPSESGADDFSEETVVSRSAPKAESAVIVEQTQPLSTSEPEQSQPQKPRIVIPTSEPKIEPPPVVRARTTTVYQNEPRRKSNTGKIIALTLLGTFLAFGGATLLYLMTREHPDAPVQNANVNTNFNSVNLNLDSNLNLENPSNFNGAVNLSNANASVKTPTPTPTPKPTASAPSLSNANNNLGNSNISIPSPTPRPSATPTPSPSATATPRPSPTLPPPPPPPSATPPSNRAVNAGVLNGRAFNLPKPAYPPIAKQMRAAGQVAVQIAVDENGNVTSAKATSGNALLRAPAEAAARQSKINPVMIDNRAVKATGILLYNFINQ